MIPLLLYLPLLVLAESLISKSSLANFFKGPFFGLIRDCKRLGIGGADRHRGARTLSGSIVSIKCNELLANLENLLLANKLAILATVVTKCNL